MTIIWFCDRLPDPLAEELIRQGHNVFEALAISEFELGMKSAIM